MGDDRSRRRGAGAGGDAGPDFDRLGALLPPAVSEAAAQAKKPWSAGKRMESGAPGADQDPARKVAQVWDEAVGNEVAANARPVQLRDGRLVVTTSSSAWAQTLQLMSPMVMAGLNERLGEPMIEKIAFRHAGWEDVAAPEPSPAAPPATPNASPSSTRPEAAAKGPTGALSADERQALDDLDRQPLDPEMKARVREAMLAGFVRARQDSGRS